MNRLTLDIDGMSCGHCVAAVTRTLGGLDGVTADQVRVGSAEIAYDAARTRPEEVVAALGGAGYPARIRGEPR